MNFFGDSSLIWKLRNQIGGVLRKLITKYEKTFGTILLIT